MADVRELKHMTVGHQCIRKDDSVVVYSDVNFITALVANQYS